jgi:maltooligosyltrehalose trehalohydrolase
VNACHQHGLAVILDVVYNHLGPEGNYLGDYGPYFTDRYRTPWSSAINFDGPNSDEVRRYYMENALYWVTDFHMDALRIDAVHAMLDFSARPFLEELARTVHEEGERIDRSTYLIPESALNDTRLTRSRELGGFGMDAQWNDDFHHALHALLTGERSGYYQDFGRLRQLAKAYQEGFVYSGEYSVFRRRRHGNSSRNVPAECFVVFSQNHDQVGNRMLGGRLSELVSFEGLKLAAGLVLLSPYIPLLFMGEEYGEKAPFPYFISHLDQGLAEAVSRGRKEEFAAFLWQGEPPDPQEQATFMSAKLNHELRGHGHHRILFELYRELIGLRKEIPALARLSKEDMKVLGFDKEKVLFVHRWSELDEAVLVFHFGEEPASPVVPLPGGRWNKRLDSAEERWNGPGSPMPAEITSGGKVGLTLQPKAFVLFIREREILN